MLLRTAAWFARIFQNRGLAVPDPTKPLTVEWHLAKAAERGHSLFVFLPGRRDRASDFVRREFVGLARGRITGVDCLTVDATLGYYLDGSIAERLQREIIGPAHANGYREIWLVGVSMGGLGAFFHEREYPGKVSGLILLAPFVGDDLNLFAEIDAAGGAESWARSQPPVATERKRAEFQRELWRYLGRLPSEDSSPLQIWMAYGETDRLRPGFERLRSVLREERVIRLKGGHTWEVWKRGFTAILARIEWKN